MVSVPLITEIDWEWVLGVWDTVYTTALKTRVMPKLETSDKNVSVNRTFTLNLKSYLAYSQFQLYTPEKLSLELWIMFWISSNNAKGKNAICMGSTVLHHVLAKDDECWISNINIFPKIRKFQLNNLKIV
jgi:hypothetical protein